MENIDIAIVTGDRAYGRALGLALLNVCRTLVINLFTFEEFASCRREKGEGFDIVLCDGEYSLNRDNAICLVEKPSMAHRDAKTGMYRLYKYSVAQQMVSDIFDIYSRITGRKPANVTGRGVHLYAFCSWAGGCGCSTLSMAVCQELTRFGDERVLYLSLEELESTGNFIKGASSIRTMSNYLFNLFKGRYGSGVINCEDEFRPFMESFTIRDDFGVESFRPTKGRNPLVDLNSEEVCVFLESIINTGRYSTIVIDTGTGLSPAAVTCLEMAEKICLVARQMGKISREDHFLQYLIATGGDDMIRKMVKVDNMAKASDCGGSEWENECTGSDSIIETFMSICSDNIYSEEGLIKKVLLEGNFGNNISKLTNKLIEPLE